LTIDEDYRELETATIQWKQQQELADWLARARNSVYIDIRDLSAFYK